MSNLKECPYCKKKVAADAIKCSYCQEWLNKRELSLKNPNIKSAIIIGMVFLFASVIPRLFLKKHLENLITEPIKYSETSKLHLLTHRLIQDKKSFTVVGEIENKDNFNWEGISILVAFKDKNNELSSVSSTFISTLNAGKKRAFEVSFGCSELGFDPARHATYTIEIEEARGKKI